jgi:hypothetical protein
MKWLFWILLAVLTCARLAEARRPRAAKQRQVREDDDDDDTDVYTNDDDAEEDAMDWSAELQRKTKTVGINGEEEDLPKKARSAIDFLHPPTALDVDQDEIPRSSKRLFSKQLSKMDYLESHHLYVDGAPKSFPANEVLMYVTPWNRKGKDYVTRMKQKVNWVAPCWYQLRRNENQKLVVSGGHDADWAWIDGLFDGEARQDLRIVPRVVIETNLPNKNELADAVDKLLQVMRNANEGPGSGSGVKRIHGFTLEVPLNTEEGMGLAVLIPHALKSADSSIKIVSVLPPVVVNPEDEQALSTLSKLSQAVDRLSIMTYDRDRNGNPNSPLEWVASVMTSLVQVPGLQPKLLLGIPMYGWRTGNEDMTADKMVLWLASEKVSVTFDEESQEHVFKDGKGRRASYPTPYGLTLKMRMASTLQIAGVAAWEAGQMPASYMDAF